MFGKKAKKNDLFGNRVDPDCRYCVHNSAAEEEPVFCALHQDPGGSPACRHFSYDPLKRAPKNLPPLPNFDPKDFSL